MNQILKRISILGTAFAITISSAGCKNSKSEADLKEKVNTSFLEYGYKTEYIDIKKTAGNINEPVISGDTLYFFHTEETDGAAFQELWSLPLSAPEEIKTYHSFSKGENFIQNLRFLHVDKNGDITFLQILHSKENIEQDSSYHLVRLDSNGNIISDFDVSCYFQYQILWCGVYIEKDNLAESFYVYTQPVPGAEELSEQGSNSMLIIDCETGETEKIEIDCEPSVMTALYSGDIAAIIYDAVTGKNTIKLWDKAKNAFSQQGIDFSDNTYTEIYPAYEDKFFYIDSSTGILSLYDLSEQKTEQSIRLMDWNIPLLFVSMASYMNSNHIIVAGTNEVYRLTKVKASEIEQKTEISLGCLGSFENMEQIAEFNRNYPDYKIVIKNYIPENEDEAAYDEGVLQLTRDILSGNAPDLIDLSNIDYQRYSGSGMFEDLYPYIHQDKEFKNRNLNQNILKLFEEDGALYALPSKYIVNGLASREQTLGEELFTLDKYLELPETDTKTKSFQRISRKKLLSVLFAYNEDYFIDYKAKTCNFTNGVFEKVLVIAKEHQNYKNEDDAVNESNNLPSLAKSGQILFYPMDFYDMVSEYQCAEKIFDNQFYITGYPSVKGDKVAASATGSLYAVSSLSQHKDICWEFIKQVFDSVEERAEFQRSFQFPVDNDLLEEYLKELAVPKGYFENGKEIPATYIDDVVIYTPTQEQLQKIRKLINRVNTLIPNNYTGDIYKILAEEAEGFYTGDKTAEDVCKVIQSRVNILINEEN